MCSEFCGSIPSYLDHRLRDIPRHLPAQRGKRFDQDWHQLIELCSLAGALLADADGVYNPNWYNDRLLLGLKARCRQPTASPARPSALNRLIQRRTVAGGTPAGELRW
jgi:hypothetical protein